MIFLRQEGKDFILRYPNGLICNHIKEVWNAKFCSPVSLTAPPISSLRILGIQTNRLISFVSDQPLSLGDIVFAVTYKTRCDGTATDRTCQSGELHSRQGVSFL